MAPNHDSNPQAGQGKQLPKKEADLFKNVVKHYEMKQYKKAIKQCDKILEKFPNHGETLAMKGLILNCLAKRDEAHVFVKQGLMNDMRSHVCWHVYGLLHRSDHNYNEAIKAYKQALKIDSDNIQILRDLSMLQIQMRDLEGFAVTRHTILTLKPNGKINWLAFALAKHLTGDLRGAISVMDIYLGTLTEGAAELARGFEASELALYRNKILAEIPDNYKEALEHLSVCESVVVDRSAWLMTRTKYQLRLGDYEGARQSALDMFRKGMTENYKIHSLYMCAILEIETGVCDEAWALPGSRTLASLLPLSDEQKNKLLDAYKTELFPQFGSSAAVQRIPMNLVDGDRLRNSLDVFCRKSLVRGVPSLCNELSTFLLLDKSGRYEFATDPVDVKDHVVFKMLVDIVDGYISCLESTSKLRPEDESEEPPSTALWTWYLRAGLHELAGEHTEGIAFLEKCLEHTPTAVDVYELKGRLLKAAGDMKAAVESLDKGRDLDRQDRYINNQTTKYMLQAGMEDEALQRISMFTKHEGNPEANLFDMQCSWYELELAACFENKEKWGKALMKYSAVVKHFDDFHEDQFDFHAYCVRKVTLRAYTDVLRFEDNLWGEQYYFRASRGIIRIYLHLFDHPAIIEDDKEPDYANMTPAQRKKAKAIARKKKNQAEKKDAERREKEEEAAKNGDEPKKKGKAGAFDDDPDGKELLRKDALEEAKKYASILAKYSPRRFETWTLQYDVSIRRKKTILALQALYKMRQIDPENAGYFSRLVDFSSKMAGFDDIHPAVKTVVTEEAAVLLKGKSVTEFVSEAAVRAKNKEITHLPTRVAIAQGLVLTNASTIDDAVAIIVDGGVNCTGVSVETCRDALKALETFGLEAKTKQWIAAVKERLPLLTDFC